MAENWNAPWSDRQVEALCWWQENMHPYTCVCDPREPLIINKEGMTCRYCDYKQTWAMAYDPFLVDL